MPRAENRQKKLKTIDLTFIALLCSIVSVSRIVSYGFIPYITLSTALVIIIGVHLGPYYGGLVGVLCIFVSNFILSHGLWTPFQMTALGLIGYLSGLLFKNHNHPSKGKIYTWGAVCVCFIYSPILSIYESVLIFAKEPFSFAKFFTILISSFLFGGIWHLISTTSLLLFFFEPIGKILSKKPK